MKNDGCAGIKRGAAEIDGALSLMRHMTYRAVTASVLRQNYMGDEKDFYQINEKSIKLQKSINGHNAPVTERSHKNPIAAVKYLCGGRGGQDTSHSLGSMYLLSEGHHRLPSISPACGDRDRTDLPAPNGRHE